MAETRKPPEANPGRTRTAPTIDLAATEVEAASDVPSQAAPEPAADEAPASSPREDAAATAPPPRRGSALGAAVGGIVFGALVIAAVVAGLWYGGYIPSQPNQRSDLSTRIAALEKQVQALENKPAPKFDTKALENSVAALSQRVGKIESAVGKLPVSDKQTAQRLAALGNTAKSLSDKVGLLDKRSADIAAIAKQAQQEAANAVKAANDLRQNPPSATQGQAPAANANEIAALQSRIAALAQVDDQVNALQKKVAALSQKVDTAANTAEAAHKQIKPFRDEIASTQSKVAAAAAATRATRLALSAAALRNAVFSGAPYTAELAQAKSLGAARDTFAALDRFAAKGLPSKNELAQELTKLMPALRQAAGAAKTNGGFLADLQASAGKLVRITPVEAPPGTDTSAVLSRIEIDAAHADIDTALADLADLPEKVRNVAQDWIVKAKARQAALAAARQFAVQASRALGDG